MSDNDPRVYVHPETGEMYAPLEDLEDAEKEIRKLKRRLRALERDRDEERQGDPNRRLILSLIERWKRVTDHPNSNANADDRFDLIRSRFREGYTAEQIELAIDGIGAFRYVVNGQRRTQGTPNQRHDRLGIALGSGEALERFANLGAEARRRPSSTDPETARSDDGPADP